MQSIKIVELLPDVDGTVIAAGPIIGGDGIVPNRIVLRKLKNNKQFVIHSQQYPDIAKGDLTPRTEYDNGDYIGEDEREAMEGFIARLVRQTNNALKSEMCLCQLQ